ncbi:peptidoglycan-binding protein [Streptomyces toxytricini]|uniref:peptidoglycan-binding protein n=1 Tax=Streptomyces toxytricini TaxID=67369 RepID=UPI00343EE574
MRKNVKKFALHAAGLAAVAAVAFASLSGNGAGSAHADPARAGQHLTKAAPGALPSPTLQEGARGEAVKDLQTRLNKHGHRLDVDGIYGPATKAAVQDLQRKHRLAVDGIAGPQTWAALKDTKTSKPQTSAPTGAALRNKIVSVARSQVTPKGSNPEDTGACNKYFAYSVAPASACADVPWCAAFAGWTWHQAGVTVRDHTLVARAIGKWGKEQGLFHNRTGYTPKPGDLAIYGPPNGSTGGHVAVVVAVHSNGTIDTVDGNYSDKVTLVERLNPSKATDGEDQHISGYVSPPGA